MRQPEVKKIIKELSEEFNMDPYDIEDIIRSQFKFVRDVIKSATKDDETSFKNVKLPYLGKFIVPKNKIKYIINNKNKNK